jgi:hypothetical protein
MEATAKKPRRLWRWLLWAAIVVIVAIVVFVLSIPFLLTHIPIPPLEFDLSPYLKGKAAELVTCKKATASIEIRRDNPEGFRIHANGKLLDWPYSASAHIRFGFIRADGSLTLMLDETDWKAYVDFGAHSSRNWHFTANVPETRVTQDNAILASILSKAMPPAISNLVFSGKFKLDAGGDCTPKRPVPAWTARGTLADFDADLEVGGKPTSIDGLKVRFGADGIADHRDIAPLFPRANSVEFAGFTLSNVFASVRATEKSYLVTEAGADCCGGALKLYSLFLDPKSLNLGATIFIDGVDAGEVLSCISAFHGKASGRLHGKLPFFLKDGKTIRFKDAHLFSTPGETGNMRIVDAQPILENLALAGVPEPERANLSKVLADLEYSVLKVELKRGKDGEDSSLGFKIEGSATRGNTTVPVNLDVTFRGDIDQLINTGMKLRRKTR